MTGPAPAVYAVEAGGSATRVAVRGAGGPIVRRFGTVNPASAPTGAVRATWAAALDWIRDQAGADCPGWIASASLPDADPRGARRELDSVRGAVRRAGLTGPVAVSNDVVPLLLAPPLRGSGFVLVGGTGSTCLAGAPDRPAVRVGGHEYVLSDEGSGYQIGLAGLRAALRAGEGTGPATALSGHHPDLPRYARRLATSARRKTEVASFAVPVLACWQAGDQVAKSIVDTAVTDLVGLVVAASRRLHQPAGPASPVLLCGSLLHGSAPLADGVGAALRRRWPGCPVRVLPDALDQCLSLAADWPRWPADTGAPLHVYILDPTSEGALDDR